MKRVWICRCGHANPNAAAFCQECKQFWSKVLVRHEDRVVVKKLKGESRRRA